MSGEKGGGRRAPRPPSKSATEIFHKYLLSLQKGKVSSSVNYNFIEVIVVSYNDKVSSAYF
jgi:hypothetical protein